MKERPIIFSGDMVRAILDGRKTQTRRMVKAAPHSQAEGVQHFEGVRWDWLRYDGLRLDTFKCPYGKPGDRLWVRETTWECIDNNDRLHYAADGPVRDTDLRRYRRRPSIHMPKWASRITLEVTAVRVERLQDISEEDAVAEGCYTNEQYGDMAGCEEGLWPCPNCEGYQVHGGIGPNMGWIEVDCKTCDNAAKRLKSLWESINGPDSWAANPWVWVIEFNRVPGEHVRRVDDA